MPRSLCLTTLALVAVASVAPAIARADEPVEILFAPALDAPVVLGQVSLTSDYEPVGAALQARVDVEAALAVDLSLFGWAHYDWSEQTLTLDGFVGDDAAGERVVMIEGEWGAGYRFSDAGNAPTTWNQFEGGVVDFSRDWTRTIGGVFLPNTPETPTEVDVSSSGSYVTVPFDVEGGSPATGLMRFSYSLAVDGTWTGDVIEVALEPGGEPVAVFDDYQQLLDLPLDNPGPDGTVSIYATHRSTLSITRADGVARPSIDLETPYVDEFDPEFEFDFPLTLNLEIALPETEIVIPGVEFESGSTGGDPGSTGGGSESTGGESSTSGGSGSSTGLVGDTTGGADPGGGGESTGETTGGTEPLTGTSGGVGEASSGAETTAAMGNTSNGCGCTANGQSSRGLAMGLLLLGLGLHRRRSFAGR